jgi:hypothetical protein
MKSPVQSHGSANCAHGIHDEQESRLIGYSTKRFDKYSTNADLARRATVSVAFKSRKHGASSATKPVATSRPPVKLIHPAK